MNLVEKFYTTTLKCSWILQNYWDTGASSSILLEKYFNCHAHSPYAAKWQIIWRVKVIQAHLALDIKLLFLGCFFKC